EQALSTLEQLLVENNIGETTGHMEFRASHVVGYWLTLIFDGAPIVSGSSVDVGKTWGYPGDLISTALVHAGMDWPKADVFDPHELACRPSLRPPSPGPGVTPEVQRERERQRHGGLVMDALNVALLQLSPSETSWYISTGQLRLVFLTICEMARNA
ncbi:unnamed protein product, partial [Ectocarpus fasciculatus]